MGETSTRAITSALSSISGTVDGKAEVLVRVEASGALIQAFESAKGTEAYVKGRLTAGAAPGGAGDSTATTKAGPR